MTTEILHPVDEAAWLELRLDDVTSTESAALFGMSPYMTAFELWHAKHDRQAVAFQDNERATWGRRLEAAIAMGIAADRGWDVRPLKCYMRDPTDRIGSSFDFEVVDEVRGKGILEIKNVDSLVHKRGWTDDEAPEHIEGQLQHQLEVAGYSWGAIAALVGGNSPVVLIRERDEEVGAAIRKRVREFWQSIEANAPPPPVYPEDAAFVVSLHQAATVGKLLDLRTNDAIHVLAAEYAAAAAAEKEAGERKQTAKAQMLEHIGDAEKALLTGYSISAGLVGPAHVEYDRPGYRNFRLTTKKEKA